MDGWMKDGWNIYIYHKQTSQGSNIKTVEAKTLNLQLVVLLRILNYFIYKLTMQASHSHMSSG